MNAFHHLPVMAETIVEVFGTVPPGIVLDATLGGGGHTEWLLAARHDLRVLGLDQDAAALQAAHARLDGFGERFVTHRCRFDHLALAMHAHSIPSLSGALFDLGVSSPQLDQAERGFSYQHDAALDMRMDQRQQWNAADVVNTYDERSLAELIARYGDERFATRIAKAIVAARPIETTVALAEVVVAAIPAAARRTGGHPAKRTFQAIRIAVNGELDVIEPALRSAIDATAVGGRIAVLSYHSGEDRIVKQVMNDAASGGCVCPHDLPCVCDAVQTVRVVKGVPKRPTADEQRTNRRASSARLRVIERIVSRPTRGVQMGAGPTRAR